MYEDSRSNPKLISTVVVRIGTPIEDVRRLSILSEVDKPCTGSLGTPRVSGSDLQSVTERSWKNDNARYLPEVD